MPYVLTDRKHFHAHRYGKLSPIRNFSLSNVIELYIRSIMGQKKKIIELNLRLEIGKLQCTI